MTRLRKVLHVPDTHAPFHDKRAFGLMLQVAQALKPDEVVVLGDFFDVYSVSRHDKDPLMDFKTWKDEIRDAREALETLQNAAPAKKLVFMCGNHEVRLEAYINNYAPKLSGLFKTSELLCIPGEWEFFPYGQEGHYKIGSLTICHGSRAGENPAASMVKKYRSNVMFGHTHKLQEYHISNIHGDDFVALNAGWLGDQTKAAKYIKDVSDWSLGFAVTYHKSNGSFFYQLIHIKKNKGSYECMFGEEVFQR
jgi:predicted phosphodiesterase